MPRSISNRKLIARCRQVRASELPRTDPGLIYANTVARLGAEGYSLARQQHSIIAHEIERDLFEERRRRRHLAEAGAIVMLYAWSITGVTWAVIDAIRHGIVQWPQ